MIASRRFSAEIIYSIQTVCFLFFLFPIASLLTLYLHLCCPNEKYYPVNIAYGKNRTKQNYLTQLFSLQRMVQSQCSWSNDAFPSNLYKYKLLALFVFTYTKSSLIMDKCHVI